MIKKVLKRDNLTEVPYDRNKIFTAIMKANNEVEKDERLNMDEINLIVSCIEKSFNEVARVEDIQDLIENDLMDMGKHELCRAYMSYRFKRNLVRKSNTTDESIMTLLKDNNDEVSRENSNKKAAVNSTKRDLIAGEVSKDLSKRLLLPPEIVAAHERGTIHFHDMDYFMMDEFNCCLPNFRDMLENGFAINGVKIDPPKSFRVACNQVTQIMASVASNQYGGQTFYSDVLGKYLRYTKEKIITRIKKSLDDQFDGEDIPDDLYDDLLAKLVYDELNIELEAGVQTIQYQINTLMTTNGSMGILAVVKFREPLPSGCESF